MAGVIIIDSRIHLSLCYKDSMLQYFYQHIVYNYVQKYDTVKKHIIMQ